MAFADLKIRIAFGSLKKIFVEEFPLKEAYLKQLCEKSNMWKFYYSISTHNIVQECYRENCYMAEGVNMQLKVHLLATQWNSRK